MMKKLMHNTVAAAGFAALLLTGACASNHGLGDDTDVSDKTVEVRPEVAGQSATVVPAPGPAKVDSDGNVYSSSAAPGTGNHATVGTNTNVNTVPDKSRVDVTQTADMTVETPVVTETTVITPAPAPLVTETTVETTPVTTTTRTETATVPMTSSVQESTTSTDTTPTRTRMRKD